MSTKSRIIVTFVYKKHFHDWLPGLKHNKIWLVGSHDDKNTFLFFSIFQCYLQYLLLYVPILINVIFILLLPACHVVFSVIFNCTKIQFVGYLSMLVFNSIFNYLFTVFLSHFGTFLRPQLNKCWCVLCWIVLPHKKKKKKVHCISSHLKQNSCTSCHNLSS